MENRGFDPVNESKTPKYTYESKSSISGRVFGGLIVVAVGVILLARQMGVEFPFWLISWEMLMIAIGLYIGFRHSFRGPAWIVLVLIGAFFLADDIDPTLTIKDYVWPIVIIAVGLVIIFRPQKKNMNIFHSTDGQTSAPLPNASDDVLDSVTIFGGLKKNIISKNFRGGEVTTIFGGTDLNLTQADMTYPIVIEITQIFGGAKLIVPPHWKIQSEEIVSIFGGVEDKRPIMPNTTYAEDKVIILKGTNIFGGIDIKSF